MTSNRLPDHRSARALVLAALVLAWTAGASALPISSTDLWNGAAITGGTGVHPASDARDMFGGNFSGSEPTNTVFPDGQAQGTVHAIEWQTAGVVTLRSIVLNAQHDGPEGVRDA